MSTAPTTSELRWLTTPALVELDLPDQLVACWREVSNAGGAVGFPFMPVSDEQVLPAVEAMARPWTRG